MGVVLIFCWEMEQTATIGPDFFSTYFVGLGSFGLLVLASWCVGEGGEILGAKYDASIIGGLVIAWLNTAPEAIFFITALNGNNPNFAMGAVSGSTIVVATVALRACLYVGSHARNLKPFAVLPSVKRQCYILAGSVVIPLSIAVIGFSQILGVLGVLGYLSFMYYSITNSGGENEASKMEDRDLEVGLPIDEDEDEEEESVLKGALYLLAGGILIVVFSSPFITSVVEVATYWNFSPALLAFFLAPVASEAPEILESISLSRKGNVQNINITISNMVGGTITKTTLLCGILCFYGVSKEFAWESPSYGISLTLLALSSMLGGLICGSFHQVHAKHGLILFSWFIVCSIIQYYYNAGVGLASFELMEEAASRVKNFGV